MGAQGPPSLAYGFLLPSVLISDSSSSNRPGTSSDMVDVEVRINIPKETNSPDSYVVRTFVLEK